MVSAGDDNFLLDAGPRGVQKIFRVGEWNGSILAGMDDACWLPKPADGLEGVDLCGVPQKAGGDETRVVFIIT